MGIQATWVDAQNVTKEFVVQQHSHVPSSSQAIGELAARRSRQQENPSIWIAGKNCRDQEYFANNVNSNTTGSATAARRHS